MSKKRKHIKRVYKDGREISDFLLKKSAPIKRDKVRGLSSPKKESSSLNKIKPAGKSTKKKVSGNNPALFTKTPPKSPFVETVNLPAGYNSTQLRLLAKDPYTIYAYWEIAESSYRSIVDIIGDRGMSHARRILRFYDVSLIEFNGMNAHSYFDIDVGDNANNWYVKLWKDGVSYIADLGLILPEGRFFSLCRSNSVQTPRQSYSPRRDEIWMKVAPESPAPVEATANIIATLSKARTAQLSYHPRRKKVITLSEDDIRKYYSGLNPLLKDIISSRVNTMYGKKASDYKFTSEGEYDKHGALMPKEYFIKRLLLGASESMVITGGASENRAKGASDFFEEKIKRQKFFFELNTELIVHGRTEPDAKVWLGQKMIPLGKDGRFTLRFSLPDGQIPLEFKAISKDGSQSRSIDTHIVRRTEHKDKQD